MAATRTRSTRATRATVAAAVLLPAASGAIALTAGSSPAGAAVDETHSVTFTDTNAIDHTCTITATREYPYRDDNEVGRGGTSVSGDSSCTNAQVSIQATYTDPNGNNIASQFGFATATVERRFAPIGSNFKTFHDVTFFGCSANCNWHFERTK